MVAARQPFPGWALPVRFPLPLLPYPFLPLPFEASYVACFAGKVHTGYVRSRRQGVHGGTDRTAPDLECPPSDPVRESGVNASCGPLV